MALKETVLQWGFRQVIYDRETGVVRGEVFGGACCGYLTRAGESMVALYVEGGVVWAQSGCMRFALREGVTRLHYEHRRNGTTLVRLRDDEKTWEHSYASWWVGREYSFEQVMAIPELSAQEEEVLVLDELIRSTDARARFVERWGPSK